MLLSLLYNKTNLNFLIRIVYTDKFNYNRFVYLYKRKGKKKMKRRNTKKKKMEKEMEKLDTCVILL